MRVDEIERDIEQERSIVGWIQPIKRLLSQYIIRAYKARLLIHISEQEVMHRQHCFNFIVYFLLIKRHEILL